MSAELTKDFWQISRAWNGRCAGRLTVETALKRLNHICRSVKHGSPLWIQAYRLKQDIVTNAASQDAAQTA